MIGSLDARLRDGVAICAFEEDATCRKSVNVRGLNGVIAVSAKGRLKIINANEQHVALVCGVGVRG